MQSPLMGSDITRSALIIVDMQNDFLHPDGSFSRMAMEHPEYNIDMPFLVGYDPACETAGRYLSGRRETCCLCRAHPEG